jgi:hypothetical protein
MLLIGTHTDAELANTMLEIQILARLGHGVRSIARELGNFGEYATAVPVGRAATGDDTEVGFGSTANARKAPTRHDHRERLPTVTASDLARVSRTPI